LIVSEASAGFDWGLLEPLSAGSDADALTGDGAVLAAFVAFERELGRAWVSTGVAPATVLGAFDAMQPEVLDRGALAAGNLSGGNPVIALVAGLRKAVTAAGAQAASGSDAAGWVHRGATSQDVVDTGLMLVLAAGIRRARAELAAAATSLAAVADAHRHTPMVGRTLTQHAAPTTFGVVAASWLDGIGAALAGLDRVECPVQLGGAVGNGSVFAVVAGDAHQTRRLRAALAEALGLTDPGRSWHTERTPLTAVANALSTAIGVTGRIAADLAVLARTEIAEVTESAAAGAGASSAMPQKRNPVTPVLLLAQAKRAPFLLAAVHAGLVAEDQRPAGAWHAEWQPVRELARIAIESTVALAGLVANLEVDARRMRANLELTRGLVLSEQAGAALTAALGRSEAGTIVGRAVELVGVAPIGAEPAAADLDFTEALRRALDDAGHSQITVDLSLDAVLAASDHIVDAALARAVATAPRPSGDA
jgi:3-carboxy-cis,cis-muconate cycloisomerase